MRLQKAKKSRGQKRKSLPPASQNGAKWMGSFVSFGRSFRTGHWVVRLTVKLALVVQVAWIFGRGWNLKCLNGVVSPIYRVSTARGRRQKKCGKVAINFQRLPCFANFAWRHCSFRRRRVTQRHYRKRMDIHTESVMYATPGQKVSSPDNAYLL